MKAFRSDYLVACEPASFWSVTDLEIFPGNTVGKAGKRLMSTLIRSGLPSTLRRRF